MLDARDLALSWGCRTHLVHWRYLVEWGCGPSWWSHQWI